MGIYHFSICLSVTLYAKNKVKAESAKSKRAELRWFLSRVVINYV